MGEVVTGGVNAIECAKIRGGNHGVLKSFTWAKMAAAINGGIARCTAWGSGRGEERGGAVVEIADGKAGGGRRCGR